MNQPGREPVYTGTFVILGSDIEAARIAPVSPCRTFRATLGCMWIMKARPGEVAVVTGATSGIGKAYASALAELGYDLVITGRRRSIVDAVADEIRERTGRTIEVEYIDFSHIDSYTRFAEGIAARRDIAGCVCNAGFGVSGNIGDEQRDQRRNMLRVHTDSTLELVEAIVPTLKDREKGFLVFVSSVAAFFPMPGGAVYSATKAFLVSLSQSLAMELDPRRVRVQALCPGMTRTDFHMRMGLAGKEITQRKMLAWKNPQQVVSYSLRCLKRNVAIAVPGCSYRGLVHTVSHLPRRAYFGLVRFIRV